MNSSMYQNMNKKELFNKCEELNIKSYKNKNKNDLIELILKELNKNPIIYEENIIDEDDIQENDTTFTKIENMNEFFENIVNQENKALSSFQEIQNEKIEKLYKLLHNANMRTLNYQFKCKSQYPVARYNNLEELKRRINVYND
jgi:hypothetical protein